MTLSVEQARDAWVDNYLAEFVPSGGAAVKVVSVKDALRPKLEREIRDATSEVGFAFASVRAERGERLHLVQSLFWAIARQLPWELAARRYARLVVEAAGYEFDPSYRTIAALAEANGLDVVQMDKPIARALRTLVLQNPKYSRNVKRAILALVSGAIDIDGIGKIKSAVAQAWFKGEPVELKRLKEYHISNRIARNNARNLLYEVSAWFAEAGYAGVAVYCDMSDFLSPSMTKGQSLDFYEIIRQLIDNVGLASNLFVLFATSPEFTTSEKRGIRSYDVLGIRLADDFYDTQHPNPLAPLVELGGSL